MQQNLDSLINKVKQFSVDGWSLGVCYAKGDGVNKDYSASVKWYRMAAEQGNLKAQLAIKKMNKL